MKKRVIESVLNNRQAIIELAVIAALTVIVYFVSGRMDAFDSIHKWLDSIPDDFDLDEIFISSVFLTFAFGVFSFRRWREIVWQNAMRRQAEEQLKMSEEKYRLFLENIPDVTWTSDEHGNTIYISPNVESVYGFTPEEFYKDGKRYWLDRIHPDDTDKLLEQYGLLFSEQKPFDLEYRVRHKNGNWIWVHDRANYAHKVNGITYTDGIFTEITERKHIEEERDKVFDLSIDLMCIAGFDGFFRRINPAFMKTLGYTKEYLMSHPFIKTVHPDDVAPMIKAIRNLAEGRAAFDLEVRSRCADGSYKMFAWTAVPVVEEGLFYATGHDITKRKQAEAERAKLSVEIDKQRNRLNDILSDIPCVVWEAEIDRVNGISKTTFVNNSVEKVHGYTLEEWLSKPDFWLSTVHPEDKEIVSSQFPEVHETGRSRQEFRWITKEGRTIWCDNQIVAVKNEEGEIIMLRGVTTDITERKRVEEALRESEQRLSLHIQQTPLAVMELSMDEKITEWNHAAERIFGYTKEEVLGRRANEFLISESIKDNIDKVWQDLISQKGGWRSTNENLTKDGRTIICEWYNTPLNDKGVVIGVASLAQDITENKQMEKDLERTRDEALESARLKSEFLANMSHEIRTPMNGVIGMASLLLDTKLTPEQRDFAETIQTSGESLLTIIDDILDFSKIEAGKLRFENIDFDLREIVENPVELLAQRAQAKGLELASIVYNDVPANLVGDPGRLRQVLTNLIGNGIKFTERGEVSVHVKKQNESANHVTLRFEIQDTGIGISGQNQQRLFQAFTQADGSTTRKYGGTGLGLAISKQLVQLMCGEIGVESTPGKGSTFWFTANFKRQSGAAITRSAAKSNLSGLSVLIVDDNETNRKIFVHHALSWGMSPVEAESAEQALKLLRKAANRKAPFDLVMLDLQMPEMDGIELARTIKTDEKISDARLVLLTSFNRRDIGERALLQDIEAHLCKPIRQSQLYNCLVTVMANAPVSRKQPHKRATGKTSNHEAKLHDERNGAYRVLVAEDNLINRKVALSVIKNLGYKTDAVVNGCEAIEAFEREKYDLILMDCQMPVMDGYEATMEIRRRETEFSSHTPIIAMTAHVLEGEREKCIAAGMDDYLGKPVKPQLLYEMLKRWLPLNDEPQTPEDFSANVQHNKLNDAGIVRRVD